MDKKMLESYRSKKEENIELYKKLEQLRHGDNMVGNDVILDYRTGYPIPQTVIGVDYDRLIRTETRYKERILKNEKECEEVERFIEAITDSQLRRIFRMCYIDGMKQLKVSRIIHLDQSRISRKIDDYLKNA